MKRSDLGIMIISFLFLSLAAEAQTEGVSAADERTDDPHLMDASGQKPQAEFIRLPPPGYSFFRLRPDLWDGTGGTEPETSRTHGFGKGSGHQVFIGH